MEELIEKFNLDKRSLLEKTKDLVTLLFEGKKDKAGHDYIEHLLFVEKMVETTPEKIVALLHDTLEDTPITLEDLKKMGYPKEILESVFLLTKRHDMSYVSYIDHLIASNNEIALKVKQMDLKHNMDLGRFQEVRDIDRERVLVKYTPAYAKIEYYLRKKDNDVRH